MEVRSENTLSTAILLFGFSAKIESRRKRITVSRKHNAALWKGMHEKTLKVVKDSGIPYFVYDEKNQTGVTFGHRISNATNDVFELGYEKIIIVGNDCPELGINHLNETLQSFNDKDIVLGRDKRGGAFLIGITRNVFDLVGFSALKWQTAHLFIDLLQLADPERGHIIASLRDINAFPDLLLLPLINIIKKLRNLIYSILSLCNVLFALIQYNINYYNLLYKNRGSPSIFNQSTIFTL